MAKTVIELQNAFQSIVNTLKKNKKVLAIFTFGSIVTGDVWEESDIDLFVVYSNEYEKIRDVYSEILGVPVHTKLLHRKSFFELYENQGQKGFIRNLLIESRIVFSRDEDIEEIYKKARYSTDDQIEIWNLVYLGNLIKDLGVCRKYFSNGGFRTSYEILIRVLDSLARLFINLNGYVVSKDSLTMAANLNNEFKEVVDRLFYVETKKESIIYIIDYVNRFLDENIVISCKLLLDYLEEKNDFLSSNEIKKDEKFKNFDIKIENILKELEKRKIIVKKKRGLKDSEEIKVLDEIVYAMKNRKK
ncbi:nucleotidyltransferase domain-containing protein [Clostridium sp. HBUAS56017]|uniref:Nucleotidyltransferase domain-containing protein n=1 Tax=Clostridium cibarium TaxID=2762247 RepID=A0ABR8PNQ8_9CLOT|nr:nucleotidyltransferase domain-containing protein [Clostridium sp. HBUAS56017]MBD7909745.1 nucleotidyltransferase domain-containing protein [Clostridium cibarium]